MPAMPVSGGRFAALLGRARATSVLSPALLAALLGPIAAGRARAVTEPADVIVYADRVPAATASGAAFVNPFIAPREDPDDSPTRLLVSRASGLRLPRGTGNWGVATWGKYVLVGNYDENAQGVFQDIEDQVVGVFDSETHAFCELDIDPSVRANAGVQWLSVADPAARRTRIYFEGIAAPDGSGGAVFGYIEGDVDNPAPCDPVTGWRVVRFTAGHLNAAGSATDPPCPDGACGFDGLALLDPETVVLGNWMSSRIVVLRVGDGVIAGAWVHALPHWQPPEANGDCYVVRPVSRAAVDPTRDSADLRFTQVFDTSCFADDPAHPQPSTCTPFLGLCPATGEACSEEGCPGYCEQPIFGNYVPCTDVADCRFNLICGQSVDLGSCTTECRQTHPSMVCSGDPSRHCTQDVNCPTGQQCVCNKPWAKPAQEYSFDGHAITATSGFFQAAPDTVMTSLGRYDTLGNLWLSASSGGASPYASVPVLYRRGGPGHRYDATTSTTAMTVVPDQADIGFEGTNMFNLPVDASQVGGAMYLLGRRSLQRALLTVGGWVKDTGFKTSFGIDVLPSGAHACTETRWCEKTFCDDDNPCAVGECVPTETATFPWLKAAVPQGGAPSALWTSASFSATQGTTKNFYVFRIPLATPIPDANSTKLGGEVVRPAIAWSGDRLWMVAEHAGSLMYRVRHNGFWSTWYPFTAPIAAKGGAAVTASSNAVEVFVRGAADSRIYGTLLAAPTCTPGACAWSPWTAVTASPRATADPAVAFQDFAQPTLVIRDSDGAFRYSSRFLGTWSPWTIMGGLKAADAASIAWHPADGSKWVVARDRGSGRIRASRILGDTTYTPWDDVGDGGALTWQGAPAVASNGEQVRVFAAAKQAPAFVHQTIWDGARWGGWRALSSGATAVRQPSAADVHGEINLVTYGAENTAVETSVEGAPPR